ncbi:hypothetical protein [Kingella potus]|nr:hypothetical protein [Kingella potus]UOP01624.1 hypothetical protein LVJ84_05550 [Kingella potus]
MLCSGWNQTKGAMIQEGRARRRAEWQTQGRLKTDLPVFRRPLCRLRGDI